MTMSIRKIIFSVAAAAVTFTSPVPAAAQEVETASVHYGDLDLSTAKGIERFNRRAAKAAEQVCGDHFVRDLELSAARRACRNEIMNSIEPRRKAMVASGTRYTQVSTKGVLTN
jgi:UrcA family protein